MVELQPSKLIAWVRFPSPACVLEPVYKLALMMAGYVSLVGPYSLVGRALPW